MINPKKKYVDIQKIQNCLKIDPPERSADILNEIHDEIYELEFFANLIKQNQRDFVKNVLCKYMTCLSFKKKQLEQNRDNLQIILEGKVEVYIPPIIDNKKDEDQTPRKLKKKYIHSLHQGQCINLQTACFKKLASFYFDCNDHVILLNIPCVVDNNISILSQIDQQVRDDYDFIFETLLQRDSFYTQQQVRDILFVSKKNIFQKGHIQLKNNGLIIFILKGEFSIFKDFFKQNKVKDSNSGQKQTNYAESLKIKNGNSIDNDEEDEDEDDQNDVKGTKINELQNLKMQFKKKDSQQFKRVRLGIKKPGSLVVLAKKDSSIDGIECLDSDGIAFICTEELYESITKEQDRRSDTTSVQTPQIKSENLLQTSNQLDNFKHRKSKLVTQANGRKSFLQIPIFSEKALSKSSFNEEVNEDSENSSDSNSDSSINDSSISPKNKEKHKDNSKGNMLRNKFELNYRKSMISNIGQQIKSLGEFYYTNKNSQKDESLQMLQQQKNQQIDVKKTLQPGIQQSFPERQSFLNTSQQLNQSIQNQQVMQLIDNTSSNPLLTEQDEEKIMKYLTHQQPKRSEHRKSQTWVSPFQKSKKDAVRGSCASIQIPIFDNISRNSSIINRDHSDSNNTVKQFEQKLIQENSLQRNQSIDSISMVRSKSSFLISRTPSFLQPQQSCNTPIRQLANRSQINGISTPIKSIFNDSSREDLTLTNTIKKNYDQRLSKASTLNVPKLELRNSTSSKKETKQYCGYNFISSASENNTPDKSSSPTSTTNDKQEGFTDNYTSVFQRQKALKKLSYFSNTENTISQDNTLTNDTQTQQKAVKEKLVFNRYSIQQQKQRQIDNNDTVRSTTYRASSTHNLGEYKNNVSSINNLSQFKKDQTNQSIFLKNTPTITVKSFNNLPISMTMTNISILEQPNKTISSSLDKRTSSARQKRVGSQQHISDKGRQASKGEFNIFSKQNEQNNTVGISQKQEILYNKNIMQILYPQKMKKFDQKTRIMTSKLANHKELETITKSPNTFTNIKSKQEIPVEKEFELFIQKKLRPHSSVNRHSGEKQINNLNKKVLNQYVYSLNNQNQTITTTQNKPEQQFSNQQLYIKSIFHQ